MLHPALGRLLLCAALALGTTIASAISDVAPAWAQSDEAENEDEAPRPDDSGEVSGDDGSGVGDSDSAEPDDGESASDEEGPDGEMPASEEDRSSIDAPETAPSSTQNVDSQTREPETTPQATATPNDGSVGKDSYGVMLDTRNVDYYDRRAAELLKSDKKGAQISEHPLASAYPGHYVVICEAGCPDGTSAQVVSMTPRIETAPQTKDPRQDVPGLISCVGGCPSGGPGQFVSMPGAAPGGSQLAASVGEWMTTVARLPSGAGAPPASSARAPGSGDWMEKINADRAAADAKVDAAPAAAAPAKPSAAPSSPAATMGESLKVPASGTAQELPAPVDANSLMTKAESPSVADDANASVDAAPEAEQAASAISAATDDISPAKAQEDTDAMLAEAESAPSISAPAKTPDLAPAKVAEAPAKSEPAPAPSAGPSPSRQSEETAESTPSVQVAEAKPAPAPQPQESEAAVTPSLSSEAKPRASQSAADAPVKVAAATPANDPKIGELQGDRDRVMSVLSEDEEMNAAIAKARSSLSDFWKSYEMPGASEGDFALKVAISDKGVTEHFWLTRIQRDGDKLSGVISNQPQSVKAVKLGQTYEFTADMISDWTFKRNGKLVGNETMRVLLPRMPAEQAAAYRAMYETP